MVVQVKAYKYAKPQCYLFLFIHGGESNYDYTIRHTFGTTPSDETLNNNVCIDLIWLCGALTEAAKICRRNAGALALQFGSGYLEAT